MAKKKKTRKAESRKPQPPTPRARPSRFWRYCFVLLLSGVVVLAWVSMLTFHPDDPPAKLTYPPADPQNGAGIVGAYMAYGLNYWLGGGSYMGLLFASVAAVILMLGGRITHWPWRLVGVALLVAATSTAIYMRAGQAAGDLYNGRAGVLGWGAGEFLSAKFGQVGGWTIVTVVLCAGMMLAAEKLVLQMPRLGKKVWQQRKELPSLLTALRRRSDVSAATASGVTASPRPAAAVPATVVPVRTPPKPPAPPKPLVQATPAEKKPNPLLRLIPRRKPKPPKPAPAPKPAKTTAPGEKKFNLPPVDLLAAPSGGYMESQEAAAAEKRDILQQTLNDFNIDAQVVGYMTGPVITMYELSLSPGVKVAQIFNLATDMARALAVPGVRVVSPIPGKDTVGIEVPNMDKEIVRIRELMEVAPDAQEKMHLPVYLGKDAGGGALVWDLATMPHILLAGTTGSGKSVSLNAIIMSMLLTRTPDDVRLVVVDPKMVEMAAFENIPHLLCPIVNDMRRAEDILEWAVTKMDERYELFKETGVRNIAGFNRLSPEQIYERLGVESDDERAKIPTHIPYYVIVIDELADLMMTSGKEVEHCVIRIAQKARAIGIHLVLATQRPSVNVVTGLIKSNMPCRISFRVASRQESRIVLDQNGADVLLGAGDMLFLAPGNSHLIRAQGTFVDDSEVRVVVNQLRTRGEPKYNTEVMRLQSKPDGQDSAERDELFDQAVEIVLDTQRGSVSLLQRRLSIGYSRASRIIDQMADAGFLGDYKGSQAREVLLTLDEWQQMKESADEEAQSAVSAGDSHAGA